MPGAPLSPIFGEVSRTVDSPSAMILNPSSFRGSSLIVFMSPPARLLVDTRTGVLRHILVDGRTALVADLRRGQPYRRSAVSDDLEAQELRAVEFDLVHVPLSDLDS